MTMRLPDGRDLPLYDPTKGLPETPGGFQFSAPLPAPTSSPGGQANQAAAIQKSGGYGSAAPAPVTIAPPKAAEPAPAPATEQPIVVRSQGYTTPAGWVPGQRTERGVAYDPEAMQALREARQTQAQDQATAAQEKAGPTGEFARDAFAAQQEEQRLRAEAETAQARADENRAEIRRRLAEVEKDHAELQGDKIDPSKFWTDRGAFATAISVAAMAMGEYARILGRSGSNTAADMIDAQIQRDIDAQKANIELRRQGVQVKETLLDRYMQTNDPERSEQLARATLREAAAAEIAKNKAIAGKADTLALVSDLRNKAAITIAEQDAESTKREVSGTEAYQQAKTVGGGAVAIDPRIMRELKIPEALWTTKVAQKAQEQYMSSQATAAGTAEGKGGGGTDIPATMRPQTVPGLGTFRDVKEAELARQDQLLVSGFSRAKQDYEQALKQFKESTGSPFANEANRRLASAHQVLLGAAAEVSAGPGKSVMADDRDFAEGMLGSSPTGFFTGTTGAEQRLDQGAQMLTNKAQARIDTLRTDKGATPAATTPKIGAAR